MGSVNKNMAFGSIQSAQPSSAGSSRPASSAGPGILSGPPSGLTDTPKNPSDEVTTPVQTKVMPKIDMHSFFQSNSGGSPTGSPTAERTPTMPNNTMSHSNVMTPQSGLQTLHASTPGTSSHQQSLGSSSRRASTYDNATTAALSPRLSAANLPLQGTPLGGMPLQYQAGGSRPFSPINAMGGKISHQAGPLGHPVYAQSPPFGPGGTLQHYLTPGQANFAGSQLGKPNGLPINGQSSGPNQQRNQPGGPIGPGQPSYIQGRQPSGLGQSHPHNRSLGSTSPRIQAAQIQSGMQSAQSFYPGPYAQQQWVRLKPRRGECR